VGSKGLDAGRKNVLGERIRAESDFHFGKRVITIRAQITHFVGVNTDDTQQQAAGYTEGQHFSFRISNFVCVGGYNRESERIVLIKTIKDNGSTTGLILEDIFAWQLLLF
jgi:hypothetical protein